MTATELVIRNEEDAWRILKDACGGKLPKQISEIKFENWPIFEIKLEGEQFNSSLNTKMMEGFIELQKNINRAYADLYHNRATGQVLTEEERKSLELTVKVTPGCSDLGTILESALKELAKGVASKVDGTQVVIMVIGCALIWGGVSAWKAYLQRQKERDISTQGAISAQFASSQETERMKILADALTKEPRLKLAKEGAEEVYNKVLKGAASADEATIAGHAIKRSELKLLVRTSRSASQVVTLNGDYRVLKVDNSNPDHFKVDLEYQDGRKFNAKLAEAFFNTPTNKQLIQNAEWERKPIKLMVEGTELRGEITTARIIDVLDRLAAKR